MVLQDENAFLDDRGLDSKRQSKSVNRLLEMQITETEAQKWLEFENGIEGA